MRPVHDIAAALAAHLAADNALAEAAYAVPRIYLDAIGYNLPDDGRPVVYIHPSSDHGIVKGDRTGEVHVVVGLDSSVDASGNSAASEQDEDGVYRVAAGDRLTRIVDAVIGAAKTALPGADLQDADAEYDYAAMPDQYATITLSFVQIGTYQETQTWDANQ